MRQQVHLAIAYLRWISRFHSFNFQKFFLIHLVRFNADLGKNSSLIRFSCNERFKNSNYDLVGTINHLGSIKSGHYTANIKIKDKWCLINDDNITLGKEEDIISKDAYILIYKRCT